MKQNYMKIINKIVYIIYFTFLSSGYLLSDSTSISPTINDHIYISEWSTAGLENGELGDDFPLITGTVQVDDPTGDDYQKIDNAINRAYLNHNEYGGIWAVMLQPSNIGTYVVDQTITMEDSIILRGPFQWKSDKDEGDRAIIEFEMSSPSDNCITFNGLTDAGIEDVYLRRIDAGETTGIDHGVTIYMNNCNNCFVSGVQSWYPVSHHVSLEVCNHIEVRGCYFQGANNHGEGGQGYGVVCTQSEYCLVEDNIFETLRHSMLVQDESRYNVFGYNYSRGSIKCHYLVIFPFLLLLISQEIWFVMVILQQVMKVHPEICSRVTRVVLYGLIIFIN